MKSEIVPYVSGMDTPVFRLWANCPAETLRVWLDDFQRAISRPWHTVSLWIYPEGAESCWVSYTWSPSGQEKRALRRFIHDHCA